MPKRTNTFQRVAAIVQRHMAGDDAEIVESAMVTPIAGGRPREVDALITSTVAGHTVRIAVEAVDASKSNRPATIEWIDRMIGKHQDLPADRLVLYSRTGYTPEARRKGEQNNLALIEADEVTDDEAAEQVLDGLRGIWPKFTTVDISNAKVAVQGPSELVWFDALPGTYLYLEDGTRLDAQLREALMTGLNSRSSIEQIANRMNLRDISESCVLDATLTFPLQYERDDVKQDLYVEITSAGSARRHKMEAFEATIKIHVDIVGKVDLNHARLGEVHVAYGEWTSETGAGTVVASVSDDTREMITVRLPDGRESTVPVSRTCTSGPDTKS